MSWDNSFVDELKMQINIVDVIGKSVDLKKAGANYKGLCPFHSEKTPSFMVSEEKQIFNCFGCGEKGDVIKFVESYNKVPFMEAVEMLCHEYGIKMPEKSNSGPKIDYDKYYKINALAGRHFYNALGVHGNRGLSYLYNRKITKDTITKWGLGYATAGGNDLVKYLRSEGVSDEDMIKLGLASVGKSGELYDKFRDRVMYPIINTQNNIIGFGGRAIDDIKPKYLNSPESEIFLKKNNLFGLNINKQDITSEDKVVIVEGYMDVISLWQNGVRNAVASLGTSLTENQVKLINRYTKNIVLSYDSDNAGIAAAIRGIELVSQAGIKPKVLTITDGKDPDDYVKQYGRDKFNKLVLDAIPGTEYKINAIKKNYNLDNDTEVIDCVERIVPILKELSPVEQDIYIKKISKEFNISDQAIMASINTDSGNKNNIGSTVTRRRKKLDSFDSNDLKIELSLIILAMKNPKYIDRIEQDKISFRTPIAKKVLSAIELIIDKCEIGPSGIDEKMVFQALEPDEESLLASYINSIKLGPVDEVFYKETWKSYFINRCKEDRVEILNELAVAEKLQNFEDMDKLAEKLLKIDSIIKEMTEGTNV